MFAGASQVIASRHEKYEKEGFGGGFLSFFLFPRGESIDSEPSFDEGGSRKSGKGAGGNSPGSGKG
jgi:hypothetical protein